MIIRLGLNFAAHFAAGVAFGALAVVAAGACLARRRQHQQTETAAWEPTMPPPVSEPPPAESGEWGEPPGQPSA